MSAEESFLDFLPAPLFSSGEDIIGKDTSTLTSFISSSPYSENFWLVPASYFASGTPSLREGIPTTGENSELAFRQKTAVFIMTVASSLGLPQLVAATACVFMHRFYSVESVQKHPFRDIAGAALFLATKVEECYGEKFIYDLARVCAQRASKQDEVDAHEVEKWQLTIIFNEVILAEALSFDFVIEHPYLSLLLLNRDHSLPQPLVRYAWAWINDSYRLPLCMIYPPRLIAAAALCCACLQAEAQADLGIELKDSSSGKVWWELFDVDASLIQGKQENGFFSLGI